MAPIEGFVWLDHLDKLILLARTSLNQTTYVMFRDGQLTRCLICITVNKYTYN